jgi:hypothetical protein
MGIVAHVTGKRGWKMSWGMICGGGVILVGVVIGLALGRVLQSRVGQFVILLGVILAGALFVSSNYDQFVAAWEWIHRDRKSVV